MSACVSVTINHNFYAIHIIHNLIQARRAQGIKQPKAVQILVYFKSENVRNLVLEQCNTYRSNRGFLPQDRAKKESAIGLAIF